MSDTIRRLTRGRGTGRRVASFGRFFDDSPMPMGVFARDGGVIAANRSLREMLGYPAGETERFRLSDVLFDGEECDRILSRLEAAGSVTTQVRVRRRDSMILECRIVAGARRDASGAMVSVECVFEDLTVLLRLQDSIRASEEVYRSGFERSAEARYIAAPDGLLIDANERWLERFGYTREELEGLRIDDMYASAHHRDTWTKAGLESSNITNEVPLRRKDGSVMYGQHVVVAARDEEGGVIAYHGTIRDVTDLRLSQILEGQERMFGERLMETSPACVLVFNSDGVVVFANHETERVLGMAREHVIGMTSGNGIRWIDPEGKKLAPSRRPIAQVLRSGSPVYGVECAADLPLGVRTLLVSAAPLFGANDEVTCVVTTLEDITGRKLVEASLRASLEERATLLREVYHRVKNNLAAIIGLTELRKRATSNPEVDAVLSDLVGQVRSMAVAHDLLCQSKTLSRIDMGGYFRTLLSQLPRAYCYARDGRVSISADGVELDLEHAVPLGMIVNELAMNSVKHGFPEGKPHDADAGGCEISVSLRREGSSYTLVVHDNGCGLPPGFDWRESETMGLHLIRMLGGHQLQGTMDMDGTHGTTFRLCFSVNEPERS